MNLRAIAVYLRVSTSRQDLRSQEPELQRWLQTHAADRPVVWYRDRHTGRSLDRPALGRLERDIIAGKVGTVVVWRNDRMGRRARQLLVFLEDLDERKIDYISVRDGHLTGDSASAKIFRHMLVGMAEYESNLISERTRAGLAAKKARGETWGGRKKGQRYRLTPEKLQAVKGLLAEGLSKAEIARQLRIARSKHGLRSDHASCLICPLPAGNAPHKCRRESSWKQRWRGLSVGRLMFPLQSSFAHSR